MASAEETLETVQKALELCIRPREEAAQIRRVLALHLRSCCENGPGNGPLALVEPSCRIKPAPEARGLQGAYLKALHANIKAQQEYDAVKSQIAPNKASTSPHALTVPSHRLEEHVNSIKLERKRDRLQTVDKYLDLLLQKPAASAGFLEPDEIFRNARELPEVPRSVVGGFALDKDSTETGPKALVDRLEKTVLRSKLLLKKEEQLLEQVKSRSSLQPGEVSNEAKLAALNTTRNELISWIETELGKASGPDDSEVVGDGAKGRVADKEHRDGQLALIKKKYADYSSARKALIQLVVQCPQPSSLRGPEAEAPQDRSQPSASPPPASACLLTPYIENLLVVAHEQKSSITQKSYLHVLLAKQMEETCQVLDHLAEESQLLPAFPVPGAAKRKQAFDSDLSTPVADATSRVKSWAFAADSAKIATLEAVAEKIEEGQVALEGSTKFLDEVDQLLGRDAEPEEASDDTTEDDIWLAQADSSSKDAAPSSRKHTGRQSEMGRTPRDIWSVLDGNLGLIGAEGSPRR